MEPNDFLETSRNELLPTCGETGSLSAAHNPSLCLGVHLWSPPGLQPSDGCSEIKRNENYFCNHHTYGGAGSLSAAHSPSLCFHHQHWSQQSGQPPRVKLKAQRILKAAGSKDKALGFFLLTLQLPAQSGK